MSELISIAKEGFSEVLGVKLVEGQYTEEEKKLISQLRLKYSSPDWIYNLRKPLSGDVKYTERKFPSGLVRLQVKLAGESIIESVLLTGDFFVEPRRTFFDLEFRLKWSIWHVLYCSDLWGRQHKDDGLKSLEFTCSSYNLLGLKVRRLAKRAKVIGYGGGYGKMSSKCMVSFLVGLSGKKEELETPTTSDIEKIKN